MLQSMTGYGKAFDTFLTKKIILEIRSLNSKGSDIYLKLPSAYKAYELPIRKKIQDALTRGKIECTINIESIEGKESSSINKELAIAYYQQMKEVADSVGADGNELLTAVFRLQDVMQVKEEDASEEEWIVLEKVLLEAIQNLNNYRLTEGETLKADFTTAIDAIESRLAEVPKYEAARVEVIRERMHKSLEQLSETVDENRFEQELIYYIEKLDVSEEKTRLQHHLDYFRTTMESPEAIGKKLGFISQEIGREINTLGSKSYNADLQKLVVEMKDNLEKIKEQVLNTL